MSVCVKSLFIGYLDFEHPYYKTFFLYLSEDDRNFVLDYLSSSKGCFPYEIVTGFESLSSVPPDGDFWPIDSFYSKLRVNS